MTVSFPYFYFRGLQAETIRPEYQLIAFGKHGSSNRHHKEQLLACMTESQVEYRIY